jgi:hypothetical protein
MTLEVQARGTREFLERFAQPDQKDLLIAQQLCVSDFEPVHEGYGLCDLNLRPRPAFYEFQKLARPTTPRVQSLRYHSYPDGRTIIAGRLSPCRLPSGVEPAIRIVDEQNQTRGRARLKDPNFTASFENLPADVPLLAKIYLSGSREHPIARLPLMRSTDSPIPNPDFEGLFRAGVPWGWTPVGQAICRDGAVFGPEYCHKGKASLVVMLFDNARHYRFNDRLEVPVVAASGQQFNARCFSRYKTNVKTNPAIHISMSLIDPASPPVPTHGGVTIGREWTKVSAQLTAPCNAPTLVIYVNSDELPRDDGKKRRWFVFLDDVDLIPEESRP